MTSLFYIRRPAGNSTSPVQKMRTLLLLLLVLSVGASALKWIIHRYAEKKTWHEAQAYCRQHHTDLLTIRDQTENDEITDDGWIGLYRESLSTNCKWSSGHANDNYCDWASGEPDSGQYCGFKKGSDTGWHSEKCDKTFPFYCGDDPLVLVKDRKPWEEALEYCRHLTQYHPTVYKKHQYELASPLMLDNVDTQYVFQGSFNKVWIGLRYLGGQWSWLSRQNHDDHLANCPHIHRCGTLEKNATINIARRRCDAGLFFLCARQSDMP